MRATWFLVPQLSVAFLLKKKRSSIYGLKESPTPSSIDAKASPTFSAVGAMKSPMKSAKDIQAMSPETAPVAFVEKAGGHSHGKSVQAMLETVGGDERPHRESTIEHIETSHAANADQTPIVNQISNPTPKSKSDSKLNPTSTVDHTSTSHHHVSIGDHQAYAKSNTKLDSKSVFLEKFKEVVGTNAETASDDTRSEAEKPRSDGSDLPPTGCRLSDDYLEKIRKDVGGDVFDQLKSLKQKADRENNTEDSSKIKDDLNYITHTRLLVPENETVRDFAKGLVEMLSVKYMPGARSKPMLTSEVFCKGMEWFANHFEGVVLKLIESVGENSSIPRHVAGMAENCLKEANEESPKDFYSRVGIHDANPEPVAKIKEMCKRVNLAYTLLKFQESKERDEPVGTDQNFIPASDDLQEVLTDVQIPTNTEDAYNKGLALHPKSLSVHLLECLSRKVVSTSDRELQDALGYIASTRILTYTTVLEETDSYLRCPGFGAGLVIRLSKGWKCKTEPIADVVQDFRFTPQVFYDGMEWFAQYFKGVREDVETDVKKDEKKYLKQDGIIPQWVNWWALKWLEWRKKEPEDRKKSAYEYHHLLNMRLPAEFEDEFDDVNEKIVRFYVKNDGLATKITQVCKEVVEEYTGMQPSDSNGLCGLEISSGDESPHRESTIEHIETSHAANADQTPIVNQISNPTPKGKPASKLNPTSTVDRTSTSHHVSIGDHQAYAKSSTRLDSKSVFLEKFKEVAGRIAKAAPKASHKGSKVTESTDDLPNSAPPIDPLPTVCRLSDDYLKRIRKAVGESSVVDHLKSLKEKADSESDTEDSSKITDDLNYIVDTEILENEEVLGYAKFLVQILSDHYRTGKKMDDYIFITPDVFYKVMKLFAEHFENVKSHELDSFIPKYVASIAQYWKHWNALSEEEQKEEGENHTLFLKGMGISRDKGFYKKEESKELVKEISKICRSIELEYPYHPPAYQLPGILEQIRKAAMQLDEVKAEEAYSIGMAFHPSSLAVHLENLREKVSSELDPFHRSELEDALKFIADTGILTYRTVLSYSCAPSFGAVLVEYLSVNLSPESDKIEFDPNLRFTPNLFYQGMIWFHRYLKEEKEKKDQHHDEEKKNKDRNFPGRIIREAVGRMVKGWWINYDGKYVTPEIEKEAIFFYKRLWNSDSPYSEGAKHGITRRIAHVSFDVFKLLYPESGDFSIILSSGHRIWK